MRLQSRLDNLLEDAHVFALRLSRTTAIDSIKGLRPYYSGVRVNENVLSAHLIEVSLYGHMLGFYKALQNSKKHFDKKLGVYESAISFMQHRLELTLLQVDGLRKKYGVHAVDVGAGWGDNIEQELRKASAEIVSEGLHVQAGVRKLEQVLKKAGNPWYIETAVRTQIHIAYSAGRWDANSSPEIQEILWGYEYITAGDFRVRPSHDALEGTVLPKDSPEWASLWPPNGYNCRCDVLEIYNEEISRQGIVPVKSKVIIDGKEVIPGPDKGWAVNHGKMFETDIDKTQIEIENII